MIQHYFPMVVREGRNTTTKANVRGEPFYERIEGAVKLEQTPELFGIECLKRYSVETILHLLLCQITLFDMISLRFFPCHNTKNIQFLLESLKL